MDGTLLKWPSWTEFKTGLAQFEEKLSQYEIKTVENIEKFKQRHPLLDKILNSAIETLPDPVKSIVSNFYKSFDDVEKGSKEVFNYIQSLSQLDQTRYEIISSQLSAIESNMAKEQTLLLMKDVLNSTNESISDLIQKTEDVKRKIKELSKTIPKEISRPQIISALNLGQASVTVGTKTTASMVFAQSLGVKDLFENLAVNDTQLMTDTLKARFGTIVSESFLLGRQMTLLFITEPNKVTPVLKNLLLSRIGMISDDEELVQSVDKFWTEWTSNKFGDGPQIQFFGILFELLRSENISESDPNLIFIKNAYKAKSANELNAMFPNNDKNRNDAFLVLLKKLKEHGINDPTIDLFLAAMTGDTDLLIQAEKNGADTSKTDSQIVSYYHDLLEKIAPNDLAKFYDD